jgi:hypothetical protein
VTDRDDDYEPTESESPGLEPVTLDYIEAAYESAMQGSTRGRRAVWTLVPQLIAELRELRADQQRWRDLEVESRFLVTAGQPPGPGVPVDAVAREAADVLASADADAFPMEAPVVWVKRIYETGWEKHVPTPR